MIRSCGSTSGEGWLLEASRFIRVSCCTLFVTTRDATHIRADLHVLARTYAAVRDLQVIGGMGLSQAERLASVVQLCPLATIFSSTCKPSKPIVFENVPILLEDSAGLSHGLQSLA